MSVERSELSVERSAPQGAVFLSYAREDADAARRIAEALRSAGVEVWFDMSELRGGDAWDAHIRQQIRECALFVPVISAQTQTRAEGYFRREWKLADERTADMGRRRAFLVPICIDGTKDGDADVPDSFLKVQWTRLPGALPTPQFVGQVKRLLEQGAGSKEQGTAPATQSVVPPKKSLSPAALLGAAGVIAVAVATVVIVSRKPAVSPAPAAALDPKSRTPDPVHTPASAVADKSLAVLPFANMSEDKDSTFFADGMHEDVLTNLAVIRDLRVTSRTSVMEYRGTTKKIRQIGAELGVAYVLEGSVRRAGNKVRVTGQLINVATDEHVWAKSYDRDLTDIFAIQSELAQAIATALSAALSPQEKSLVENRPTTDLAAYDLYLKARAWGQGYDQISTRAQVEQWLLAAVKIDPAFAQAWALLGSVHTFSYSGNEDRTPERLAKAQVAIETAVRLAPGDPVVIENQGNYFYHAFKDYGRAAVHYRRLLVLNPNSAVAYAQLGFLERRQGRWLEALAYIRKSVQLDPRNPTTAWEVGDTLRDLRRYHEAATAFRQAAELAPDDLTLAMEAPLVAFYARGSTREVEGWLANTKPTAINASRLLALRRDWARFHGDWAQAVEINQQHSYLDPYDDPHWAHDVEVVGDLVGHDELAAARTRAKQLLPGLDALVEKQPTNARLWWGLAWLYAIDGDRESALRCARRLKELLPESVDAKEGPRVSFGYAQILAWTGDRDGALAELARLLRTPRGANVYSLRTGIGFLPLRGDPRFEALLTDPKNNAPLF